MLDWELFFRHDCGIAPDSICTKYAGLFEKHRIRESMLVDLNKELLRDVGITAVGDIIAILKNASSYEPRTIAQQPKQIATDKVPEQQRTVSVKKGQVVSSRSDSPSSTLNKATATTTVKSPADSTQTKVISLKSGSAQKRPPSHDDAGPSPKRTPITFGGAVMDRVGQKLEKSPTPPIKQTVTLRMSADSSSTSSKSSSSSTVLSRLSKPAVEIVATKRSSDTVPRVEEGARRVPTKGTAVGFGSDVKIHISPSSRAAPPTQRVFLDSRRKQVDSSGRKMYSPKTTAPVVRRLSSPSYSRLSTRGDDITMDRTDAVVRTTKGTGFSRARSGAAIDARRVPADAVEYAGVLKRTVPQTNSVLDRLQGGGIKARLGR